MTKLNNINKLNVFIIFIFLIKIWLAGLFSSGYLNNIFLPFVHYFSQSLADPWFHFVASHSSLAFPYPPLMLYLLTPFSYFIQLSQISSFFWVNLIIKIPIYIADSVIFYLLCWYRPQAKLLWVLFYLCSPIIFFAAYLQGQLDLIPVAFLLTAIILLLRGNIVWSALIFAAALQTKTTAIVALPFILIYVFRRYSWRTLFNYLIVAIGLYLVLSLPYLWHASYLQMVFENPQQNFIFNSAYAIGDLKLYPVILFLIAIYAHFLLYKKINQDLLLSYLNLAFAIFLIFAYPVPSWFIWVVPYLVLFLSTPCKERREFILLYLVFNIVYLIFFLFFYRYPLDPAMPSLLFFNKPIKLYFLINQNVANSIFTALAAMLVFQIYLNYRFSIRSNAIYKGFNQPVLIGVSGDSGAGKSIFLADIYEVLGKEKVTFIEGDGEHRWERGHENWNKFTHLDPKANLLHQQAEILMQLKQGLRVRRRDYDHNTGKFTEARLVQAKDYVIIAGLHPFYLPKARKVIDIKIYLDTDEALRIRWKTERDRLKRGYSEEQVLKGIQQRAPDREKYILPQKKFSDICFRYMLGDEASEAIQLQVSLSANIDLEKIYFHLQNCPTLNFDYDYSEDLHTQVISFAGTITAEMIAYAAQASIENLAELIGPYAQWHEGLRGIRQLIILAAISHHFKEQML